MHSPAIADRHPNGPRPITAWDIGEAAGARKRTPAFGSKALPIAQAQDWPQPTRTQIAKLTRFDVPADLDPYPHDWTAADRFAFEQRWSAVGAWPCATCGRIGCDHDDDLPPYRGAFLTEGRI